MPARFALTWGATAYFPLTFDLDGGFSYTGVGALTVGGSSVALLGYRYSGSGQTAIAGSAVTALVLGWSASYSGTGAVTLGGQATYNNGTNFSYLSSGGITITGSAVSAVLPNFAYIGAGSITLTGSVVSSRSANYAYSSTGSVTVAGSSVSSLGYAFAYSSTGSVTLAGSAVTSTQSGGLVNQEATDFIARMSVEPDATRKGHIDAFFTAIKAIGLAKFDAVYLFAAHDAQAARLNLISTSYNCTVTGSPTFTTDRGYVGTSDETHLNTGFNPATASSPKFTQNSSHISGFCRSTTGESRYLWGQVSSMNVSFCPRWSGGDANCYHSLNSTEGGTANASPTGHYILARASSTGYSVYKNGSSIASRTATSTAHNSSNILFLETTGYSAWSTGAIAAASIGSNLSSTEAADFYTAVNTYLTAVGAA